MSELTANEALMLALQGVWGRGFKTGDEGTIIKSLRENGFEIIERSAIESMQEAVASRAAMAAMGMVIEHAKKGDYIDGWPPGLSPPTGWRKETQFISEGDRAVARSKIVKE